MLAFGLLWLFHEGLLENYDGMRTDIWSVSSFPRQGLLRDGIIFPSTVSPPLGRNQGSAKEKSSLVHSPCFRPRNFTEGKGITACSQGVLRTLTCLFTP